MNKRKSAIGPLAMLLVTLLATAGLGSTATRNTVSRAANPPTTWSECVGPNCRNHEASISMRECIGPNCRHHEALVSMRECTGANCRN